MAITKLNSLAIPDDTIVEADLSYPLTSFSSTGIDDNATSTAITISSSGHLDLAASSKIHTTAGIHTDSDTEQLFLTNNDNEASTGVSIVEWGYQHASTSFQGDIHYIVDSRGASGKHRFYEYSGSSWTNLVSIDGSGVTFDNGGNYLDDYEEGTWTPTDNSGAGLSFNVFCSGYTKIGRTVHINLEMTFPITSNTNFIQITLPFTSNFFFRSGVGAFTNRGSATNWYVSGSTYFVLYDSSGIVLRNSDMSGKYIIVSATYYV
jgi:hypothetical protein